MSNKIIYHGSDHIIEKPEFGKGKTNNDYGVGFYTTEHIELAKEWASLGISNNYVNTYLLDLTNLKILNLEDNNYTILHWLALLVNNREFRLSTPLMKKAYLWLTKNHLIDINKYDLIIGYRADDSYFNFAKAFLNNEISLDQLCYSMKLGDLGLQVVLKSEKAFNNIKFIISEKINKDKYSFKKLMRDKNARMLYEDNLENMSLNSKYIKDLIVEGSE